jgi:hypothetical protein
VAVPLPEALRHRLRVPVEVLEALELGEGLALEEGERAGDAESKGVGEADGQGEGEREPSALALAHGEPVGLVLGVLEG